MRAWRIVLAALLVCAPVRADWWPPDDDEAEGACTPTSTSEGPNSPDIDETVAGAGVDWSNTGSSPSATSSSDANYATCGDNVVTIALDPSDPLRVTDFDFAIPANAEITGIKVEIQRHSTTTSGGTISDASIKLVRAGVDVGNEKAVGDAWPGVDAFATYGGVGDVWGTAWTAEQINATTFGVQISVQNQGGDVTTATALVNHVRITIYYTEPC